MMENYEETVRGLYTLYTILHNRYLQGPICFCIRELEADNTITEAESYMLRKDFNKCRPGIFSKFYWNRAFNKRKGIPDFWWKKGIKGNTQRKLFLKTMVEKQYNLLPDELLW